jgi:hypothetical protein
MKNTASRFPPSCWLLVLATSLSLPASAQINFARDTLPGLHHVEILLEEIVAHELWAQVRLSFADLDDDGDYDLIIYAQFFDSSSLYGKLYLAENVGTPASPAYAAPAELEIMGIDSSQVWEPRFIDLDGDGDLDLFLGAAYYENVGGPGTLLFAAPVFNPYGSVPGRLVDIDGDGNWDALEVTANHAPNEFRIFWRRNVGTVAAPVFAEPIQLPVPAYDFWSAESWLSSLVEYEFADLDGDGDLDLIIVAGISHPNISTTHAYAIENIGSPGSPNYNSAYRALNSHAGTTWFLAVADLNGDARPDALYYYSAYIYSRSFFYLRNVTPPLVSTPETKRPSILPVGLSPNPAAGLAWLDVELPAAPARLSVRLFDLHGRLAWQHESLPPAGPLRLPIPLGGLPPGIYAVQTICGQLAQTLILAVGEGW